MKMQKAIANGMTNFSNIKFFCFSKDYIFLNDNCIDFSDVYPGTGPKNGQTNFASTFA